MEIVDLSALELGRAIRLKQVGVREAVLALQQQIQRQDDILNAYIASDFACALEQADALQKNIDNGDCSSPLAGVPIGIKDNICVEGLPTTCASRMLERFIPPYSATAVHRLEKEGMLLAGKLNMDEFAMGSTNETSYFAPCKNPWDTTRVPGGSSGGAAAAVAAREAFCALGSDTGGSIRQPCSFCGVTGIKPTYGRVSRYGLVAFASSLDQIGPMARDVKDVAAILDAICGWDEKDSTCYRGAQEGFLNHLSAEIEGLKVGLPTDYFGPGLAPEVKGRVLAAAKTLESLGAIVEEFSMPIVEYAIPAYYIIACAEASSNLSRYDGVKYGFRTEEYENLYDLYLFSRSRGFGREVKRRIMLGNFVLSSGYYDAYYKKALQVKALIKKAFDQAFLRFDLILGPTTPTTATKLGDSLDDPLKMYLGDIYTVSVNLAGLPGLTAPCGLDSRGLPVGVQLIGKAFDEQTLLNAAYAYQQATDFHTLKPGVKPCNMN